MKYPFEVDVSVLLIFFARPDHFQQVYEQVKKARPSRLFLYQDGPREDRLDDEENIQKCREIVEDIDWDCTVYRNFQTKNIGCDPSEYNAIKWAFSISDKCIVLEDDDVPDVTFFPFCKELLDRYENDERINMICGLNSIGVTENVSTSYFFCKCSSIWGWASWKRVIDNWAIDYDFLADQESMMLLKDALENSYHVEYKYLIKDAIRHSESGKAHYESILACSRNMQSRLNIIPTRNLISNTGISENATHGVSNIDLLPKGIRPIFNSRRYPMEFPLIHPTNSFVIENVQHAKKHMRLLGIRHPFIRKFRQYEAKYRKLVFLLNHGEKK